MFNFNNEVFSVLAVGHYKVKNCSFATKGKLLDSGLCQGLWTYTDQPDEFILLKYFCNVSFKHK